MEKGRSMESMFRSGWCRVTYIGKTLYLHNEFRSPMERQKRVALDMALETGRFDSVLWDDGERVRDVKEGVCFREWLDPLRRNDGSDPEDIFWVGVDPHVDPPRPGELWYRGHSHSSSRVSGPLWLTRSRGDAGFYGEVGAYEVSPGVRLGTYADLVRAVRESGARRGEIRAASGFDGDNDNDFVYLPAVQESLRGMGLDALLVSDVMGNYEIDTLIVLDKGKVGTTPA